jgi:hypothetical protein
MVLTELCQELKNWFCDEQDIRFGTYTIQNGTLSLPFLLDGQYFRIVGSVLNDGVYKYDNELQLRDETFTGAVWAMKIPPSVVDLATEIDTWIEKNGSAASSPYQSESWGGYSYSLKSGGAESGSLDWRIVFGGSLNRWRKL